MALDEFEEEMMERPGVGVFYEGDGRLSVKLFNLQSQNEASQVLQIARDHGCQLDEINMIDSRLAFVGPEAE